MYSQSWPGCALLPVWLFLLSERIFAMDSLENVFLFLDYLTDTQRKRHVVGGGLAFTLMTVKGDPDEERNA